MSSQTLALANMSFTVSLQGALPTGVGSRSPPHSIYTIDSITSFTQLLLMKVLDVNSSYHSFDNFSLSK
jgi:hypothetical protein